MFKFRRVLKFVMVIVFFICLATVISDKDDTNKSSTDNTISDTVTNITDSIKDGIDNIGNTISSNTTNTENVSSNDIPDFTGNAYVVVNNNQPDFTEVSSSPYFETSELDSLGRCGEAKALVGPDTITSEERGSIGMIKPSGWHTVRYDDLIADKYLYNRGHLIMFKLWGNETNIEGNLITETRYANATTQLSFENEILDYIYETGSTVEYHVRPDFHGDELVARGVELQALSSDGGLKLHVYIYNVQPGIEIDYMSGNSWENTAITVTNDRLS